MTSLSAQHASCLLAKSWTGGRTNYTPASIGRTVKLCNLERGNGVSLSVTAEAGPSGSEGVRKEGREGMSNARKRRLEKGQIEKERRAKEEAARPKTIPPWAPLMEKAAREDPEMAEILGDSIGNPDEMKRRVEERAAQMTDTSTLLNPKTGSAVPPKILVRDFDTFGSWIWMELYEKPDKDTLDVLASVLRAWYMIGKLGAYNFGTCQLTHIPVTETLSYSHTPDEEVLPAMFHEMGDLEVDLGTADMLALDILINTMTGVSSDIVGIKRIVFGGDRMDDWEENMTREEDGYILYRMML
eukprot:jgi/Mesen1/9241/ME000006S09238